MNVPSRSLSELRELANALDPEIIAAEREVDRTLIELALARSPLQRVEFAQQMLATLLSFHRVRTPGL